MQEKNIFYSCYRLLTSVEEEKQLLSSAKTIFLLSTERFLV
jgi:hypothetical protein